MPTSRINITILQVKIIFGTKFGKQTLHAYLKWNQNLLFLGVSFSKSTKILTPDNPFNTCGLVAMSLVFTKSKYDR